MYFWTFILTIILKIISSALSNATVLPSDLERTGRIVHGSERNIEEFPYLVHISGFHENLTSFCGGAILSSNAIITAAHCFDNHTETFSWYEVRAGSSFQNQGGSLHNVRDVSIHPHYNVNNLHHDLAIMQLEDPIDIDSKTTKSIEIFNSDQMIRNGTYGTIAGWGRLFQKGPIPQKFHSLRMKVFDRKNCSDKWKTYYKERLRQSFDDLTKGQICTISSAGDKSQSFCRGDSGGPLIIDNKLAGITSFAKSDCTSGPLPNVFTKVSYYRRWIDQVIKEYAVIPAKKPNLNDRPPPDDLTRYFSYSLVP